MSEAERLSYAPAFVRGRHDFGATDELPATARIQAAILFADISGFTPLAGRLGSRGAAGVEELSRILNDYFGRLLAIVAEHGGEPVKFAGDALFALWPARDGDLASATRLAAACGLEMQRALAGYNAGDDSALSLRVSIASGDATATEVRTSSQRHFILAGAALRDATHASDCARPGEVAVSRDAFAQLASRASIERRESCLILSRVEPPDRRASGNGDAPAAFAGVADYIPGPVRARLDAGHGGWLAELRPVSVLFASIIGLDHLAADAPARLQAVLDAAQPSVDRYEGYVKELIVDDKGVVLVAIFGLPPIAHEDDSARAVRAAIDLREALKRIGYDSGIGVTAGRCFCGVVGSDVRREYAVVGDVMNLAARLMSAAAHDATAGGILCGRGAEQSAATRVAFQALDPITVKGKAAPVAVFRPVELRRVHTRVVREIVGRTAERATIGEALARVAAGASPGMLLVVGDAGMGKSRIVADLDEQAPTHGVAVLHGAADAVEATTPYYAWRNVFARILGIVGLEDRAARRAEVERRLGPDLVDRAPLLEGVLSLGISDNATTAELTGQLRTTATRDLLVALLENASHEPTAVVLEDGHWFDHASWTLVVEASRRVPRLLMVLTTRPIVDNPPAELGALRASPSTTTIELGPLSPDDAVTLAARRLGIAAFPPAIADIVRTRTGGHPFFAEELAYALRDSGVLEISDDTCRVAPGVDARSLSLPDTVQGAVTARIDRLRPQEQLAIKVASVIGTVFAASLLRDVHPVPGDAERTNEYLDRLLRADLTVLETPEPDLGYAFKHIITREVAYNLMLFVQRRQLHRAIAERLESFYTEDRPELLAALAHHWTNAGETAKGVTYLEKSALRTFGMGLGREAVAQGLRAAALLGVDLPTEPAEIIPLIGAEMHRIQTLLAGRQPSELMALPPLSDASVGAVIGLLLRIEPFAHVSGMGELFALIALRCMTLTLQHGTFGATPVVYAMYSIVYRLMTGDTPTAIAFSELSIELDAAQGRHLFPAVAFIYHWFNYPWVGPAEDKLDMALEAADIGLGGADVLYGSFNLSAYVIYIAYAGRPLAEVIEIAERCYERNGRRVMNSAFHCIHEMQIAKALAGRTASPLSFTDAQYDEERDVASVTRTDQHTEMGWYYASKVRLHYLFGEADRALEFAAMTLPLLPAFAGQPAEAEFAIFRALALLDKARRESGDGLSDTLVQALGVVEQIRAWNVHGPRSFAHRLAVVEGELARVEGRMQDASARFTAAAKIAHDIGHTHYEALAHERHAELLAANGDPRARERYLAARDAYMRWGAQAKVADLDERLKTIASSS